MLLKRLIDIIIATIALLSLSPLLLLIGLAIRIDSRGPIFYVDDRVGQYGHSFRIYKFRTMVVGARYQGLGLEVAQNDTRITLVGHFLRQWSLDELPQLFNVLIGDMSLIGPRPTVQSQVDFYTSEQKRRLIVKPGISGWAQVNGRNTIPWHKRIELDIWYIENWSIWLDFIIFWRTFSVVLKADDVYGPDGLVRDFRVTD